MNTVPLKPNGHGAKLFELGTLQATPRAIQVLERSRQDALIFIHRHVAGDFGAQPGFENAEAIRDGKEIKGMYCSKSQEWLVVVTEADRSCTTIMCEGEY